MKLFLSGLFLAFYTLVSAQEAGENLAVDVSFIRSNILLHSPDLSQLITDHPGAVMLSISKRTDGNSDWESLYNYPDYGAYFLYQDFKNDILGNNYAVGIHYNFYFLKRHLSLKVAEGIALTTNPYDKITNSKNNAFGSKLMSNTNFVLNYRKDNIVDHFGIMAGITFTHFSLGRIKSPNSGINTIGLNVGVNYNFEEVKYKEIDTAAKPMKFTEPVRFNFVVRGGINESVVIGSGQKAFYHIGAYADKRLNRKSALQLGGEIFFTNSAKEYIKFRSIAYPEDQISANTDYKRAGIFIGHELFINKLSIETQVGYYIYDPANFDGAVYDRVGAKYYFTKNIFGAVAVKTHGFLAEALEVGIGIRI